MCCRWQRKIIGTAACINRMAITPASPAQFASFKACAFQADVARIFGCSVQHLVFHLYSPRRAPYRTFKIPKASGAYRSISVPPRPLAEMQEALLPYLTAAYKPKKNAHGFIETRSIRTNALKHLGSGLILNIDLQDFFPSIHFGRVRGLFRKSPFDFSEEVAATLAQLCCNKGVLPQGAPTSPVISNFVCRRLDNDLTRLAAQNGCKYSRFADDITFSTKSNVFPSAIVQDTAAARGAVGVGVALQHLIHKHNFTINQSKTRVRDRTQRQEVTGLTVNRRMNVARSYAKNLRAMINNWNVVGYAVTQARFVGIDAATRTGQRRPPKLESHVSGKLEFLRMVRGKGDSLHAKYSIEVAKLPGGHFPAALLEGTATTVRNFLNEAVWVVAGFDAQGSLIQNGTTFFTHKIGFVTAAHVFEDDLNVVTSWRLIRSSPPYDAFRIASYRAHPNYTTVEPTFDLAILQAPAKSHAGFRRSRFEAAGGGHVTAIGFPGWHTAGDNAMVATTTVVQVMPWHGARLVSVQQQIISGASGGPVLDRVGHVCGVIVRNSNDLTIPNAFIDIKHIDAVHVGPIITLP